VGRAVPSHLLSGEAERSCPPAQSRALQGQSQLPVPQALPVSFAWGGNLDVIGPYPSLPSKRQGSGLLSGAVSVLRLTHSDSP
jgi:hypothetical protein